MDDSQRLKLQEMIQVNDTKNHTNEIRQLKHSKKIRADVIKIQEAKRQFRLDPQHSTLSDAVQNDCFFLFQHYTTLFHKLCRDDLDIDILYQFLDVLETIENGETDQHEASYTIGLLLKKLYIDKKLEELAPVKKTEPQQNISWKEYARKNKLI
jgi:hypothetical protein